jgi:hypothetical protein
VCVCYDKGCTCNGDHDLGRDGSHGHDGVVAGGDQVDVEGSSESREQPDTDGRAHLNGKGDQLTHSLID